MKFLFLLSLMISCRVLAFVELEDRKPLDVEGEKLTPYWAQEYIGADLVKQEMRQTPGLVKVPVSVYDSGFEKDHIKLTRDIEVDTASGGMGEIGYGGHGTSVASLLNWPGMVSASEVVDFVQLRRVSPDIFYYSVLQEIKSMPVRPWIISNSMGWETSEVTRYAQQADQMGIIWVMASGNSHPLKIEDHERLAPVISVGSYSPRGLQTMYSQESDQLDILAPGDDYQAAIDGMGARALFGATSGATPLVSATIANVKSLLPSLSRSDVEFLLKKTALRSFHSLYLPENKTGLLNAYKAWRVAQNLKAVCKDNHQCLQTEIRNSVHYRFARSALSAVTENLCQGRDVLSQQHMNELRRQYFLNPQHARYAQLLSCAYRNEGYSVNADNYDSMVLIQTNPRAMQAKVRRQAVTAVQKNYVNSGALRDVQILDDSFRAALVLAIKNGNALYPSRAQEFLQKYDETGRVIIMESLHNLKKER
ncbi:S8/S53 family peptidase [Bdellovibrio bacteriovorus]|uniref:Peptidase S8/S53 domain-containing protein n=1 Tax=Bdellovibrio bacteriovorus str. Tiberius TaxID=1069642 RepID=K7ZGG6_BDEBC|nr:S8/S53 family peptidase [Bdellovibrio bacteriovorus]AFY02452.1 hypothetical protein Bdt_2771 [Bdellovibrio bacteriovorus str. Tiberius]